MKTADIEVGEKTLLPLHRHRCLQLLMRQMRHAKLPTARAADYVRKLEQQVFVRSRGERTPYMRLLRSMSFNLRQNGAYIAAHYPAEEVPHLDYSILAKTTPMEAWYNNYIANHRKQDDIHTQPIDFFEGEQAAESFVQCSKCQSTEVIWEQKQTRGADESMTIFFQCKTCGKRWKMN